MLRPLSRALAILTVIALTATSGHSVDARNLPLTLQQNQIDLWLGAASAWLGNLLPGVDSEVSGGRLRLESIGQVKAPEKATRGGGKRFHPTCGTIIEPWGKCT